MKKILILIINILILEFPLKSQVAENIYAATTIPKELLNNSHSVVRKYDLSYELQNTVSAVETEHKIITILDDKGEKYTEPIFFYDRFNDIEDIEAAIYDTNGKLVKKMKKKDIDDLKPYAEGIDDNRYKKINFPHQNYPYTIEYKVTTKSKATFFFPRWIPQQDGQQSIQNATFNITVPASYKLRYKEFNLPQKGHIENNKYSWYLNNIKSFISEPYAPSDSKNLPYVMTSPTTFEIDGYKGDMSTWQGLGEFMNTLGQGRQILSDEKKTFLKDLKKNVVMTIAKSIKYMNTYKIRLAIIPFSWV
jgi:hypothetical protein